MSFNPNAPKTGMTPSRGDVRTPTTAQVAAWSMVTMSVAAQAAIVRHLGQAQAAAFRPSLVSMLFNARSFMAAPLPIRAGAVVLAGASMAARKPTGVGPKELVAYSKEHFCKPVEEFNKPFPPPGPGGGGTTV